MIHTFGLFLFSRHIIIRIRTHLRDLIHLCFSIPTSRHLIIISQRLRLFITLSDLVFSSIILIVIITNFIIENIVLVLTLGKNYINNYRLIKLFPSFIGIHALTKGLHFLFLSIRIVKTWHIILLYISGAFVTNIFVICADLVERLGVPVEIEIAVSTGLLVDSIWVLFILSIIVCVLVSLHLYENKLTN